MIDFESSQGLIKVLCDGCLYNWKCPYFQQVTMDFRSNQSITEKPCRIYQLICNRLNKRKKKGCPHKLK